MFLHVFVHVYVYAGLVYIYIYLFLRMDKLMYLPWTCQGAATALKLMQVETSCVPSYWVSWYLCLAGYRKASQDKKAFVIRDAVDAVLCSPCVHFMICNLAAVTD